MHVHIFFYIKSCTHVFHHKTSNFHIQIKLLLLFYIELIFKLKLIYYFRAKPFSKEKKLINFKQLTYINYQYNQIL
jgi:hypothetical protein